MSSPDPNQIQNIFFEALKHDADQREKFVERVCGGQAALIAEVRSLLDAADTVDEFLARPLLDDFGGTFTPTPLPEVLGSYRVGPLLGMGGMGRVYAATDERLGRPVALKVIQAAPGHDSEAWQRTEREARMLAALNHPSIATVFSLEEADGIRFFSMELLEGPTLDDELVRGPLPYAKALQAGRRIASALEAAHARRILHCDLKPGNVQANEAGEWKVLDFGIGRLLHDRSSTAICTPGYASPEQLRNEPLDERSDLFSLGCLLFECFTGKSAFPLGPPAMAATFELEPAWSALADKVSPAIERVVRILLEKNKARRTLTAAATRRALDAELLRREMRELREAGAEEHDAHHNLPRPHGEFVGQGEIIRAVQDALRSAPLVTLTGLPGCGKSRVALEIARSLVGQYPDGVWFADLTRIRDPRHLPGVIAEILGVREKGEADLVQQIADRLAGRALLIVLDNCEHVVDACAALLPSWLSAGSEVRILATSREALELSGESRLAVPPLSTKSADAQELFLARLREARPGSAPSDADLATIERICEQLDGIPLAIELAAARGRTLPIAEIERRLTDRFALLRSSRRDEGRHRTLEAAVRWSYDLLDPAERVLFRRLALFRGFSLEAAEAVAAGEELAAWDVLDALGRLVEKSLITVEVRTGGEQERFRYRMVESLRQFAESELNDEERTTAVERLGDYYANWCSEAAANWHNVGQVEWLERAADEEANLGLALGELSRREPALAISSFCRVLTFWETRGDSGAAAALIAELLDRLPIDAAGPERAWGLITSGSLAGARGRYGEAREAYEQGIARAEKDHDRPRLCQGLTGLGNIHRVMGDFELARGYYRRVLEFNREAGDSRNLAGTLGNLGGVEEELGNLDEARRLGEESLELHRAMGDARGVAIQLNNLGVIYRDVGRYEQARATFEECLELRKQVGDLRGAALAHNNLGVLAQRENRHEVAQEHYERAHAFSDEVGDSLGAAGALCNLGMVALERKELEVAREKLRDGLLQLVEQGVRPWIVEVIQAFARLELESGNPRRAARLAGGARALRTSLSMRVTSDESDELERLARDLESALGTQAADAEREAGANLGFDGVVDCALGRA